MTSTDVMYMMESYFEGNIYILSELYKKYVTDCNKKFVIFFIIIFCRRFMTRK